MPPLTLPSPPPGGEGNILGQVISCETVKVGGKEIVMVLRQIGKFLLDTPGT